MSELLITPEGLARATALLEHLKTVGRHEVAERIREAIATESNAAESAAYLDAREDQALLEQRIARLEERLASSRVARPDGTNGVLDVGERARLHDVVSGEKVEYEVVGSFESDPAAGRISAESPVGRALLGRRVGEVVEAEVPSGTLRFKILEIDA